MPKPNLGCGIGCLNAVSITPLHSLNLKVWASVSKDQAYFLTVCILIFNLAGQTRQSLNRLLLALESLERQLETLGVVISDDGQITCNLCRKEEVC